MRKRNSLETTLVAALACVALGVECVACSTTPSVTSSQSDGSVDAGLDAAVANDAILPPSGTGNALVDRLGSAAAKCGKQSSFTVPGGWQLVAIGDKGCIVHVPPAWRVIGAGSPSVSMFRDDTGTEGFVGLGGAAQTATCTPPAIRDGVLDGFASNGYASPEVLWHAEANESFGGTAWPTGHTVFSMRRGASPLIGYLWLLTTRTVAACDVVGLGFWEPQDAIETDTCTLTQVLQSIRCPSGGGEEKDGG